MACEDRDYMPGESVRVFVKPCGTTEWIEIAAVLSVTPPNPSTETVKHTTLQSTRQRKRPGEIPDEGQVKFRFLFKNDNASHILLFELFYGRELANWCVAWEPPAAEEDPVGPTFVAFIQALDPNDAEENADLEYTAMLEIDDEIDWPGVDEDAYGD